MQVAEVVVIILCTTVILFMWVRALYRLWLLKTSVVDSFWDRFQRWGERHKR